MKIMNLNVSSKIQGSKGAQIAKFQANFKWHLNVNVKNLRGRKARCNIHMMLGVQVLGKIYETS